MSLDFAMDLIPCTASCSSMLVLPIVVTVLWLCVPTTVIIFVRKIQQHSQTGPDRTDAVQICCGSVGSSFDDVEDDTRVVVNLSWLSCWSRWCRHHHGVPSNDLPSETTERRRITTPRHVRSVNVFCSSCSWKSRTDG